MPTSQLHLGHLNHELGKILDASIATSTRNTYNVGVRSFELFCKQMGFTPFPPVEDVLMLFVTSAYKRIGFKTMKVYLAGIQYTSSIQGWTTRLSRMQRLYYTLRGIRRLQGNTFSRPPRAPFTLKLLEQLHTFLRHSFSYPDFVMLKAASLLAFFGMLRASEYLCSHTTHHDPTYTLLTNDLTFAHNRTHMVIHIKQSKTDPFREGCNLSIWANNGRMCPVSTLRWYCMNCHHSGPLFTFKDGTFLTRQRFSEIIQQCLPNINLNTHSFRIGGASTAHAAGISEATIQTLGRWSSDAYRLYLRYPGEAIQQAHIRMSQTLDCNPWYPTEGQGKGSTG
jgi:hypothetical protein